MTTSVAEHGSRACYLRGCRLPECEQAHHEYQVFRRRQIAYGRWDRFADAAPVRDHVTWLAGFGVTERMVASAAGVSPASMARLMHGKDGGPPTRRVRHHIADAILAVTPAAARAGKGCLDATGTQRRLQALVAIGWPQAVLARKLGKEPSNFRQLMHQPYVWPVTRDQVSALYDELWNEPPAELPGRAGADVRAARALATAKGWPPPLAWDDDLIDDPAASPADGWRRSDSKLRRTPDVVEDLAWIREHGGYRDAPAAAVAARLGMDHSTLNTILSRARRAS